MEVKASFFIVIPKPVIEGFNLRKEQRLDLIVSDDGIRIPLLNQSVTNGKEFPMPSKKDILINNILRKEESEMVHAWFYYPRQDGSQFIINRLAEKQDIELSFSVQDIRKGKDGLVINNQIEADHVIYCGDVRQLSSIVKLEDQSLRTALENVRDFSSNGTSNAFCETDDNDISWLYLPEADRIYLFHLVRRNSALGQ